MKKYYISFGQTHVHSYQGQTFDKDCIAVIECVDKEAARIRTFELFGRKWCFIYEKEPDMTFFHRGFIAIE